MDTQENSANQQQVGKKDTKKSLDYSQFVFASPALQQLAQNIQKSLAMTLDAIVVTGPRHSGKTVFLKHFQELAGDQTANCRYRYISAEQIDASDLETLFLYGDTVHLGEGRETTPTVFLIDDADRIELDRLSQCAEILCSAVRNHRPLRALFSGLADLAEPEKVSILESINPFTRYSMPLLTRAESDHFLQSSLAAANIDIRHTFPPATLKSIDRYASGNIGLLRLLSDKLLNDGTRRREGYIITTEVDATAAELGLEKRPNRFSQTDSSAERSAPTQRAVLGDDRTIVNQRSVLPDTAQSEFSFEWSDIELDEPDRRTPSLSPPTMIPPPSDRQAPKPPPSDQPAVASVGTGKSGSPIPWMVGTAMALAIGVGLFVLIVNPDHWDSDPHKATTAKASPPATRLPPIPADEPPVSTETPNDVVPAKPDPIEQPSQSLAASAPRPSSKGETQPPPGHGNQANLSPAAISTPQADELKEELKEVLSLPQPENAHSATSEAKPPQPSEPQSGDQINHNPSEKEVDQALASADAPLGNLSNIERLKLRRDLNRGKPVAKAVRDAFGLRHVKAREEAIIVLCAELPALCKL